MTLQTPPRPSPLRMLKHEFVHIEFDAAADDAELGDELDITTERTCERADEDHRHWRLTLTVRFGPADSGKTVAYSGELTVVGEFKVAEEFPLDRCPLLVNVTAASILYGACREMLANLTARSRHGLLSLPSISFAPPPPKKKAIAKKTSANKKKAAPKKKTARKRIKKTEE